MNRCRNRSSYWERDTCVSPLVLRNLRIRSETCLKSTAFPSPSWSSSSSWSTHAAVLILFSVVDVSVAFAFGKSTPSFCSFRWSLCCSDNKVSVILSLFPVRSISKVNSFKAGTAGRCFFIFGRSELVMTDDVAVVVVAVIVVEWFVPNNWAVNRCSSSSSSSTGGTGGRFRRALEERWRFGAPLSSSSFWLDEDFRNSDAILSLNTIV